MRSYFYTPEKIRDMIAGHGYPAAIENHGGGNAVRLILLAFVLFSCATRHHAPFTVKPPTQRNLSNYEIRLQNAVAASTHLTMDKIGQVDYPEFQASVFRCHPSR
jgi:hypothetical protein